VTGCEDKDSKEGDMAVENVNISILNSTAFKRNVIEKKRAEDELTELQDVLKQSQTRKVNSTAIDIRVDAEK
jgi:F0F1-type ATP synthase epsilon subunit